MGVFQNKYLILGNVFMDLLELLSERLWITQSIRRILYTVQPRLSGLLGTTQMGPDNLQSG